ncbi:MAG: PKD domain-containing protein, partial [Candidatus Brocadiaceae bacterium]|nr:PKD domain-containing protein [Candidatus Brocadiaceae bacterium]
MSVSLYNNANQEIAWFGDGDPNVVSSTNPGVGDVDFVLDMPVQARYVRVWQVNSLVHATTEYPALAEVEVYGETAQNSAPVANAGADQTVYVGNTVTLDGSGSTDVDGDLLTYSWAFTTKPDGSTATLSGTTTVNPTFTVDKAGTYVVSLIVNDGTVDSTADTVTISTLNSAPVANAGADQTVYVGNTVTLDGSGSSDVDGNLLTYTWAFTTVPAGSSAALSSSTSVNPTFTVDKAGTYVISLIVNDGTVNSAADTVTISTLNSAPVANAGLDQSVYVGNTVTLDGSGSSDVDGDVLTYSWSFTSRPSGSTAALNDTTSANPTFTVDKAGTYVASLIVNDGTVNSAPDTITISTINVAPVANAGNDQTVPEESTVTLDGSGSSDADGNALTYSWAFTTKPTESMAILSGTTTMNPTFTADEEGTYVVSLIVNDGTVNSSPDTVTITANEASEEEIEVEVSIKPETINLKSKGKFKAFIELPEPYSADEVVLATVVCEGAQAIDGRVDGEGRYIATFNTQDLRITASSKK